MIYLSKDKTGLIQLWQNEPQWNEAGECFFAWLPGKKGINNEVAINVSDNKQFQKIFEEHGEVPCVVEVPLKVTAVTNFCYKK